MNTDLFLKIIDRQLPAQIEYEDDDLICIHDVSPQAPLHLLIIPKRYIAGVDSLQNSDQDHILTGKMITTAARLASEKGYAGFRLVFNCGQEGGQSVGHIHLHLLAGRTMNWPPG
ncbi:MAG: histidine triad nucleotide-binding protein [Proteobacteria bacterium]|nr:histidine triad nucleotide-binding protein [Pseudomonadota bacterium]